MQEWVGSVSEGKIHMCQVQQDSNQESVKCPKCEYKANSEYLQLERSYS